MCHTLISSGDDYFSTCRFSPVTLSCLKPIATWSIRFHNVSEGNNQKKNSKWGWTDQFRGCSLALGPSRPIWKLLEEASWARLGEHVTSSLSRQLTWASWASLGELGGKLLLYFFYKWMLEAKGKGFSTLGIQISLKISEEKKKEEENQGRGASMMFPWSILWMFFVVLCSFFVVRRSSLGGPIQAHILLRRSKLNNGSSREIQMVITIHSGVRFRRIIYWDARNWTTEALEKFKWS